MFRQLGWRRGGASSESAARRGRLRRSARFEPLEGRQMMTLGLGASFTLGGDSLITTKTAVDKLGDTYVIGSYMGKVSLPVPDSGGTPNMFVAKYGPANNLLWVDHFDDDESTLTSGTGTSPSLPEDIALDASGNAYVVGHISGHPFTFGTESGSTPLTLTPRGDDGFLVKIAPGGTIGAGMVRSFGAGDNDQALAVAVDPSGSAVYLGGSYHGVVALAPSGSAAPPLDTMGDPNNHGFVLKLDSGLNFLWSTDLGTTTGVDGVAVDRLNHVFAVGANSSEATLAEIDATNGSVKGISGAIGIGGTTGTTATGVVADGVGGAIMVGTFSGVAVDFDPVVGKTSTLDSAAGSTDIYLARFDSSLGLTWAKRLGSSGRDTAAGLAIDGAGLVDIAGSITGPTTFGGPGLGNLVLNTGGGVVPQTNAFVARVTSTGEYVDGQTAGGSGLTQATGLAVDSGGGITLVGSYNPPATFGTTNLPLNRAFDAFVGKLSDVVVDPILPGPGPMPVVPVVVVPTVTGASPTRSKKGITTLNLTFSTDLYPSLDAGEFSVKVYGRNKKNGFTQSLRIAGVTYDAASHTVSIRLARPRKGLLQVGANAGSVVSSTGGRLPSTFTANFKG